MVITFSSREKDANNLYSMKGQPEKYVLIAYSKAKQEVGGIALDRKVKH